VQVRRLLAPVTERADYSAVVALNVLEHIEDDTGALRSFAGLVRPGGHVIMVVPAFPSAMSDFDRAIGHYRRYRVGGMTETLRAAGLEPVSVRYVNAIGLLGWYVLVKTLKGRPKEGLPLRIFDGRVVPLLRRVEARRPPPWGQSVFAVARVR
jgi:SAM-dependent methyltransferase